MGLFKKNKKVTAPAVEKITLFLISFLKENPKRLRKALKIKD